MTKTVSIIEIGVFTFSASRFLGKMIAATNFGKSRGQTFGLRHLNLRSSFDQKSEDKLAVFIPKSQVNSSFQIQTK